MTVVIADRAYCPDSSGDIYFNPNPSPNPSVTGSGKSKAPPPSPQEQERTLIGRVTYSHAPYSVPRLGLNHVTITYTPRDTINYHGCSSTQPIDILPYTPVLTWVPPEDLPYPSMLTRLQLRAATVTTTGTFVYLPSSLDKALHVGLHTLQCTFWPHLARKYSRVHISVPLTITRHKPTISWAPLAPIYHPAFLSAVHFTARVLQPSGVHYDPSIPPLTGSFRYSTDQSTLLPPGSYNPNLNYNPDISSTPTPTPTPTPSPSPTPTPSPSATRSPTPNPTSTPNPIPKPKATTS